jgi:hypothetical protein
MTRADRAQHGGARRRCTGCLARPYRAAPEGKKRNVASLPQADAGFSSLAKDTGRVPSGCVRLASRMRPVLDLNSSCDMTVPKRNSELDGRCLQGTKIQDRVVASG